VSRQLILASGSPRRYELLKSAGFNFTVSVPEVDEAIGPHEHATTAVERIANLKAMSIAGRYPENFVLAADTIVVLDLDADETILGKPSGADEARTMLSKLSGRTHHVLTAFVLGCAAEKDFVHRTVTSAVTIAELEPDIIDAYIRTGEPLDKAGSYAAQGAGAAFIQKISGSYTNVVGLPLTEVIAEAKSRGLWTAQSLTSIK
jgi:septum formation protein